MNVQLVLFKKDLRIQDHRPLVEALARGPTLAAFFLEPEWFRSPEFDTSHYVFAAEGLRELARDLAELGVPLVILRGEAIESLRKIREHFSVAGLLSHEETGLYWTFARDKRIAAWCRSVGIPWQEYPQFGVIRGLRDRDRWKSLRDQLLQRAPWPKPSAQHVQWTKAQAQWLAQHRAIPEANELDLPESARRFAQEGGRRAGLARLNLFLSERLTTYAISLSSPARAFEGCSRLSPYITWGNLSLTEILQRIEQRKLALAGPGTFFARRNLRLLESRLAWHCHFIQKLESEPELEFQNPNRAFDGMRENNFNEAYFSAWCRGETGFPMVDACMRALHQHGWINFRMRAMLMSFASYQLWLHWRRPAQYLAKLFIDFEPGIHYSQAHMQSGVTGINTIRIYSPEKQALDQDPNAEFIKTYCPELSSLSHGDAIRPDKIPALLGKAQNFRLGRDYPEPIVDPESSYREAKQKIYSWRARPDVKQEARLVYTKHGSRAGPMAGRASRQGGSRGKISNGKKVPERSVD